MARTAQFLGRRADGRKGAKRALPRLLFFTDPIRTPEPEAMARRLPRGAAVVFRAFGALDAESRGRRLKAIARARGLILLIGADADLAQRLGADGVHLPERLAHRARRLKAAHPRWIVTAAAHSPAAARRALTAGADAAVVSTVFASRSASAGAPMGPIRLAILVRRAGGPIYGLGGIDNKKARLLKDAGLVGVAAVDAFRT
ncbi:thiamine phosphate synthase [Phenylobacterium sp.]|uniref:thiamine phosphate synthase n=1 Tax=Phenylobacterium sp. TaxID=1871053 RepID=UPI002E2F9922|nr:thiamine phosphate synthase [Phenylobacterium sp.]HEX3366292.1 thiamine phosphate synthase [Phenylobacterium sp.]